MTESKSVTKLHAVVSEEDTCKPNEHIWAYSVFCDKCGEYFEEWAKRIPNRVVASVVTTDLRNELNNLVDQKKKITRQDVDQIVGRLLTQARERGYL